MELLWDTCENNKLPKDILDFNEHRDPIEALAEDAVANQVDVGGKFNINFPGNSKAPSVEEPTPSIDEEKEAS
jgi:hypothetical protein